MKPRDPPASGRHFPGGAGSVGSVAGTPGPWARAVVWGASRDKQRAQRAEAQRPAAEARALSRPVVVTVPSETDSAGLRLGSARGPSWPLGEDGALPHYPRSS